jgi:predicted metalloprotease with PDZ domain
MYKKTCTLCNCLLFAIISMAQHPLKHFVDAVDVRYSNQQPVIYYLVSVDTAELSYFNVEMHLRNVGDTFHVAIVTHPEYDDRFWRFVEDMQVDTKNGKGNILRQDSALWRIIIKGDESTIRYRVHLPKPEQGQRPSWTPFLTSTGGLVGGPHSFMYVIGAELAPSQVTIKVPDGWQIATGLQATSDPAVFFAPSVFVLTDCPLLIGKLESWSFRIEGVPHHIVYWPGPEAISFNSARLVSSIQQIVEQSNSLFGRLPYREYTFLLQDNAYGSLEHSNSVTVGIPSSQIEQYFADYLGEIAHEYIHTWNLVRIRPAEYRDVSYKKQPLAKSLWFSEGLTMFYADLLLRRAGLITEDSSREQHLERLIRRYYNYPGNRMISPEKVSMAEYGAPGMLGDYIASTHLQGEVLGTALDLIIRDATNGKRSMDDVMRKMMHRFSGEKGFTGKDIEEIITSVCACDVHSFFVDHVRGSNAVDLNKYLRLAGLQFSLSWTDAVDENKKPLADWRVDSWQAPNENNIRLGIRDPAGCWGRAGLHKGDIIISINGMPVINTSAFYTFVRNARIGDTIRMEVGQTTGMRKINVIVTGYRQPVVHVENIKAPGEKPRRLYAQWQSGN